MHQNRLNILKDFLGFCRAELNIQTLPKISLLNDKSFVEQFRSFGEYNPETKTIKVVALNRNLADICRSLAHELCHHRQNELNMIYNATVPISRSMAAMGYAPTYFDLSQSYYWSSTEYNSSRGYALDFTNGQITSPLKTFALNTLAVRIATI